MYNTKVVTNPLEFSTASVTQIGNSTFDNDKKQGSFLSSAVKVVEYAELKPSLTDVLGQYRNSFAGENLGVTDREVHHIRLKPDTMNVYTSVHHPPHSQRTIVDNVVNDLLEQGVTRESSSP